MEKAAQNQHSRVRRSTSDTINQELDQEILETIARYKKLPAEAITRRIIELDQEWDIERALEVNASSLALTGILLGFSANKRWFILPGIVTAFLLQHGLQGWCPPLPLLRKFGFRTRKEIDQERYALKLLRHDFELDTQKAGRKSFCSLYANKELIVICGKYKPAALIMQQPEKEEIQKQFPQFEPALLEHIEKDSVLKQLEPGDPIMQTGQYIRSNILLLNGLLKVYREDDEGNEFLMYYLEPGDACALSMMCVARNETSQVKAKAVQPSEVLLIPAQLSEQWLAKYKTWHNFVIGTYRERFEELLQTLDSIVFKSLDERLVFYLKRHVKVSGPEIKLSHQQIADDLNSSREVISRLLKKLEQTGAITLHRNYLEVHDLEMAG